jgi:hypothetical protein
MSILFGLSLVIAMAIFLLGIFTYLVPANNPVAEGFNQVIASLSILAFILSILDLGSAIVAYKNAPTAVIIAILGILISGCGLYYAGDIVGWW